MNIEHYLRTQLRLLKRLHAVEFDYRCKLNSMFAETPTSIDGITTPYTLLDAVPLTSSKQLAKKLLEWVTEFATVQYPHLSLDALQLQESFSTYWTPLEAANTSVDEINPLGLWKAIKAHCIAREREINAENNTRNAIESLRSSRVKLRVANDYLNVAVPIRTNRFANTDPIMSDRTNLRRLTPSSRDLINTSLSNLYAIANGIGITSVTDDISGITPLLNAKHPYRCNTVYQGEQGAVAITLQSTTAIISVKNEIYSKTCQRVLQ